MASRKGSHAPPPPPKRTSARDGLVPPSPSLLNRANTGPPPAVTGPPPMPPAPAVTGPPPRQSGNLPAPKPVVNLSSLPPPTAAMNPSPKTTVPTAQNPPLTKSKSKVSAISSSPWFPLIELMLRENQIICRSVMNILKRSDTDLLAHALVNVFSTTGRIFKFIIPVIEDEVETTENSGTLFRGNCLASKILSSYSVSVGKDYLKQLLLGPIKSVLDNPKQYEVNPLKLQGEEADNLPTNIDNLRGAVNRFMQAILESITYCPLVIRKICSELRTPVGQRFPESLYSVVGGFFFLRFICPAIVSPEGFGVIESIPGASRRPLVLISKILQNLGNGVQFGKKEEYMIPLNDLTEYYLPVIQNFFDELTVMPGGEIDTPPVPVNDELLEKFHTVTVYGKTRITETISAYETAYQLPAGSETNLFKQVLCFLELNEQSNAAKTKKQPKLRKSKTALK